MKLIEYILFKNNKRLKCYQIKCLMKDNMKPNYFRYSAINVKSS